MPDHALPAPTALYGCMGLGAGWTSTTYAAEHVAHAERALEAALEAGFTWFDHADIYANGTAEAVFGEVLSRSPGLRERIVLQTKCGIRLGTDEAPGRYDLRRATIVAKVHASLERLRTDAVDVLLLHRPDPLAPPEEVAAALHELLAEGVVRAVGVSNFSGPQVERLQAHLDVPVVANQLEMSLHRRDWLEAGVLVNTRAAAEVGFPIGTVEHCAAHGVALQSWGSLAQGRYTGRPETDDDRATAALVRELAERHGTTPETIVLWWLRHHPARIAPVVGTSDPGRIRACADAVTTQSRLSDDEWYLLWVTARGAALP